MDFRTAVVTAADTPGSTPESIREFSTVTTSENNSNTCTTKIETHEDHVSEIDENFWSEVLSADNSGMALDFQILSSDTQLHHQYFLSSQLLKLEPVNDYGSNIYDMDTNMDFWNEVLFNKKLGYENYIFEMSCLRIGHWCNSKWPELFPSANEFSRVFSILN
ncbi:Detected protein of unknown function [Hibiscus syriacus]|uniref:Uncharacterized protein n=1 Tax=Hibiscus syriacus TaxID=106335 RepID=A0A6A2WXZ1_HIBSY|nr:Detected protein of unknown function [Hibiscus syriacus]